MSICLCNLSSDMALELVAQKKYDVTPASPDPSSFSADPSFVGEALGTLSELLPKPIEILVSDAKKRRYSSEITCHVWKGALPRRGVLALGEGVFISSPEFTLLQQASQMHQANLCQMLGRYLGTWTPTKSKTSGQDMRAPLTSFETLKAFLKNIKGIRGAGNLRLAMAYTCEGAASAAETTLQLTLSLPPELHGLNIAQPIMNYEIDLSSEAQMLYPHRTIRIDLCWPRKRFGLEYQGENHGNRLGSDYARWFAAQTEKYELWFVAKEQLRSATQMMHIGREVAKRTGCGLAEEFWPTENELQDLLDILAGRKRKRPVSYDELRKRSAQARVKLPSSM